MDEKCFRCYTEHGSVEMGPSVHPHPVRQRPSTDSGTDKHQPKDWHQPPVSGLPWNLGVTRPSRECLSSASLTSFSDGRQGVIK